MNPNRHKVYHVVSLDELRALVRIAEKSAVEFGYSAEEAGRHCLILRGHTATGRNAVTRDGARLIARLSAKEQAPHLFVFPS